MANTGKDEVVWAELQRQLGAMGLQVKRGTIQDLPHLLRQIPESQKKTSVEGAKTRRSRDGTWTKMGKKSYFGYKLNQKTDIDYSLIRDTQV